MKIEYTNEQYHKLPALGSTMISVLLDNAKKFHLIQTGELQIKTRAMIIGSALHKIVLEPEDFESEFIVSDIKVSDRIKQIVDCGEPYFEYPAECLTPSGALSTSKKAKEIIKDLAGIYLIPAEIEQAKLYKQSLGKEIITTEDYQEVLVLKEKLMHLENFKIWLDNGVAEQSYFGNIDGVEVKCRPDLLVKTKAGYIVIDLKTMGGEATPEEFAKKSGNYNYFLQEALYREVLRQNGIKVIKFLFAGVSKLDWSGAGYFEHDHTALDLGKDLLQKAIFKYKWCKEHDIWEEGQFDFINGGFFKINEVILPNYIFYKY
jgi:hypothetical protein